MASIIEGYSYDVFISYRQKDNKGERWVSEFVESLRTELDSTSKEDISIYFDENPHDGLLETQDVDATLQEKLKCLVFVPVISRTYCDPKSYAWKHEFMSFIDQALTDRFGLKIRLLNGNTTTRVLPVRIHDLERADLELCNKVLGGIIRPVDLVFRSPGVNRPLRANEDHPHDNLNKIYYRDQVNKIANAIVEIISGVKEMNEPGGTRNIDKSGDNFRDEEILFGEGGLIMHDKFGLNRDKADTNKKKVHDIILKFRKYILTVLIIVPAIALLTTLKFFPGLIGKRSPENEAAAIHAVNAKELYYSGNLEESKREIALALKLDPHNSSALTTLAAVSFKEGNIDLAVKYTLNALEYDRNNSTAAFNLGIAFEDSEDFLQAERWYSEAIRIDSSFVPAYSALGRLNNRMKRPADAVLLLKLAEKKYPDSDKIYLVYKNLGNSYLLLKQYDEAIRYLESSYDLNPGEIETSLFLAKAYEAAGEIVKSIEAWQRYILIETDSARVAGAKLHLKEITVNQLNQLLK